jgi:sulfide:quinone oxidoreductase
VLVIASGASLIPAEIGGLTGPGWQERIFTFYTLEGAIALRDALSAFDHGRLVVNLVDLPIKCPVAPLELLPG